MRCGASLIDTLAFVVVVSIPMTLIYGDDYWFNFSTDGVMLGFWDFILSNVAPIVGTIWFWLRFMGTPGKMILNLKVVDADSGEKLSLGQAIGRYLGYIVAFLPLCLGIIWVGIDKRKQGWHDKLAGTVVVRNRATDSVNFKQNIDHSA
ncbi:MAG: RDD family protein [Porticoccaceae bacterium]|nr:RDD family protein [Porticoccaceae bacterium]